MSKRLRFKDVPRVRLGQWFKCHSCGKSDSWSMMIGGGGKRRSSWPTHPALCHNCNRRMHAQASMRFEATLAFIALGGWLLGWACDVIVDAPGFEFGFQMIGMLFTIVFMAVLYAGIDY